MTEIITPAQASQLRAAASVLRDLYDDGYIDHEIGSRSLTALADDIDEMVTAYVGCEKAPTLREVT